MPEQLFKCVDSQRSAMRLPRTLSSLETWGFGLTGHVGWISTAPLLHAALGAKAILIWLPGVIVSVLLNLQVQRLGRHWSDVAGGTPNYAARLLSKFPILGSYVAIAYFVGWAAAPAYYGIFLKDLIKVNLEASGISCPETLLKFGFTAIAFIVAYSGSRALSILHLFFVIPAITFLLAFCFQGIEWLAISTPTESLLPTSLPSLSFGEWTKWFFATTYTAYSCETAAAFVADSKNPNSTLRFLSVSAWLMALVFLGGSLVLTYLDPHSGIGDSSFLNLLAASKPFWGKSASFLVTLLISFSCLLSCATAVSNSPRVLYQLALDRQLAPVFTVVSRQGVLEPALLATLLFSLLFLVWGDLSHIAMVAGTSYLVSIMGLHLGLWLCRGMPEVRWPWWSLCFFAVEAVALVVGGLAWNWRDLLIGLLLPIVILTGDAAVRRIQFAPFHPQWWLRRYSQLYAKHFESKFKDFVVVQVIVLIVLVCGTTTFVWMLKDKLNVESTEPNFNLLVVLLVTLSFVAIAIACWTTLPQIAAIDEARTQAKNLFITTLDTVPDTILVLDKFGTIRQINPAAEELFQMDSQDLIGHHLSEFFPTLIGRPQQWSNRSEHIMEEFQSLRIIEFTISQPSNRKLQAYVAIMRDITERKSAENEIRNALEKEKELNELKSRFISMTSHEFRTPLTTIFSSTELLQDYSAKWAEDRKQKHFQRILTAVKHMNQLLNDVLLIGQAEAGKSKCNPALLDVIHFCQDLVDELQITANSHTITFVSQSDRLHAYLDEKMLRHILSNLLSNAIKYSPEGGNVSFTLNCEQGKIIFRVQDRGIGIPAADQAQLFDTFHRASNVGTISGTGLGLAIVKKAIDLQHGQITFESEVGVGTTFIVSLPLQPEDYSEPLPSARN